jgi:hypothetical protein
MSDIKTDIGAEIVRFPAAPAAAPEGRRARAAAYKEKLDRSGARVQQADPAYWRDKALAFRHAALTTSRNDEAAILIRRAEEFERMVAIMEAERQPVAAPEKRLHAVVERMRDAADQLRETLAELPVNPMPGGLALAGAPPAALASPPRPYIARRAQRLAAPPLPEGPRPPIARRAQRLARG